VKPKGEVSIFIHPFNSTCHNLIFVFQLLPLVSDKTGFLVLLGTQTSYKENLHGTSHQLPKQKPLFHRNNPNFQLQLHMTKNPQKMSIME